MNAHRSASWWSTAGGRANTGRGRILDIEPKGIHERAPLAIGSVNDVLLYESFFRKLWEQRDERSHDRDERQ